MQGFNMGRYVPPDLEGTVGPSGNQAAGKRHALGARASKLASQGILTVRFEMPFAVWCAHCPKPTLIGQGVRFNAEKRRVGSYHSSPIFAFRLRHADCGGALEIRTDPARTAYVVTEGGKQRDRTTAGDDDDDGDLVSVTGIGMAPILTDKERDRRRGDAFANLETTIEDRAREAAARHRIGDLADASARAWEDPYARNRALRRAFRAERQARERETGADDDLRDRMSLGIELAPATASERAEDARRAALVDFGSGPATTAASEEGGSTSGGVVGLGVDKVLSKPLFSRDASSSSGNDALNRPRDRGASNKGISGGRDHQKHKDKSKNKSKNTKQLKSEIAAAQMRENIISEIVGNTRATQDPFLSTPQDRNGGEGARAPPPRILGIKRKRQEEGSQETKASTEETKGDERSAKGAAASSTALVEYASDSD
ncbi:Protein saf4 [Diatrype stigma]|uniref:Protein saf4 n=1 Tax=Diatrype stigma TaxID=117547 RepID=A0AAN9UDL2_9PEZI